MSNRPNPARTLALRLIAEVAKPHGRSIEQLLETERRHHRPDDAGLAREIAAGVCRRRLWLEHVLARFVERPFGPADHAAHDALLMGIYQAAYLDRIPAHTIVDETVELVGVRSPQLRALSNAVMRKVVALSKEELLPAYEDSIELRFGLPGGLVEEIEHVLPNPAECEAFCASIEEPAPLCLRRVARPGVGPTDEALREAGAEPDTLIPGSFIVDSRSVSPTTIPGFADGFLTVEDTGGQIAGYLAGAKPGDRILDLCAAPGGKTAHLADVAERRAARIVACDISEKKLELLRSTLVRLGLEESVERRLSEDVLENELDGSFDLVLVDAPCSGLGTLRRHPEIRWRRDDEAITKLSATQSKLLEAAARLVAQGGTLVYSVCTFTKRETDDVADQFQRTLGKRFSPAMAPEGLPFDAARFSAGMGRWRTWSHRDGCDAFFVARWRRGSGD